MVMYAVSKKIREMIRNFECAICGAAAKNKNFGVYSCESCKAFARRNAHRFESMRCDENGQCDISAVVEHKCPGCRMTKCIQLGMNFRSLREQTPPSEKRRRLRKMRRDNVETEEGQMHILKRYKRRYRGDLPPEPPLRSTDLSNNVDLSSIMLAVIDDDFNQSSSAASSDCFFPQSNSFEIPTSPSASTISSNQSSVSNHEILDIFDEDNILPIDLSPCRSGTQSSPVLASIHQCFETDKIWQPPDRWVFEDQRYVRDIFKAALPLIRNFEQRRIDEVYQIHRFNATIASNKRKLLQFAKSLPEFCKLPMKEQTELFEKSSHLMWCIVLAATYDRNKRENRSTASIECDYLPWTQACDNVIGDSIACIESNIDEMAQYTNSDLPTLLLMLPVVLFNASNVTSMRDRSLIERARSRAEYILFRYMEDNERTFNENSDFEHRKLLIFIDNVGLKIDSAFTEFNEIFDISQYLTVEPQQPSLVVENSSIFDEMKPDFTSILL